MTIARQGNERENSIWLEPDVADGSFRHRRPAPRGQRPAWRFTHEEQFAPTLTGLGTRAPVDIYQPNPLRPGHGLRAGAHAGATARGGTTTVGAYAFDTVEVSSRVQVSGGFRWDSYDTEFRAVDAAGAHDRRSSRRPTA